MGQLYFNVKPPNWQVKLINVKPWEQLSLQMHNHRSEHWVVKGIAKVEIDKKVPYFMKTKVFL